MIKLILSRVFQAVPVFLLVVTITFAMVHAAPGGPFDQDIVLPPDVLENLRARYHLDDPFHVQLGHYFWNLLQGDLGPSFKFPGRSVSEMISTGFPVTFELAIYAILFALLFGILAGLIASARANSLQDYIPMSFAMLGICVPAFVLGPVLILFFGIYLGWVPVSGWGMSAGDKFLPSITLGAGYAAYIARITRGGMLEVLSQDYIRTAKAKGAAPLRVIFYHAIRGGISPVIAFLGPALAGLLAGSFVVESVFQIPGLGRLYIQAAFNRDYTMVLGTTIFFAGFIVFFNLIADIILLSLDPRARRRELK